MIVGDSLELRCINLVWSMIAKKPQNRNIGGCHQALMSQSGGKNFGREGVKSVPINPL